MRRKYLLLPLVVLILALPGCRTTTVQLKPGAPGNLTATAIAYNQIDLNWEDNSDAEDGFVVACNVYEGIEYYEVVDLAPDTTYFCHSGLQPLTTYRYYVYAYNEKGESYSNQTKGRTLSGVKILDYELEKRSTSVRVTGHARNTTNEILARVRFIYWFYDANNILIDSMEDSEDSIPPLTTFEFGSHGWAGSGWDRIEHVIVAVTDVDIH